MTSEKLQSLIADPYYQLTLDIPAQILDLDLKGADFDGISISCKSLTITAYQLTTSFIHRIKKVQQLMLSCYGLIRPSLTDPEVRFIADWINNSNLKLTQLTIENYDFPNLPVIANLKSLTIANTETFSLNGLNISAYSNLRCLKLSHVSIKDVCRLDGIHELHLLCCDGIRDISCLNHNYKIVIDECKDITDYSNSFRYSKIIEIAFPSTFTLQTIQGLDLSKAHEARKIYVGRVYHKKPLLLPQSSRLHEVQVEHLDGPFTLPSDHQIRQILVRDTPNFISLIYFNRIYSVKLLGLRIYSLEGLGSGNRGVEVNTCPLITDFSPLRHCDKVTIRNCQGFQDINQVRGVKEISFSPADVNKLPNDMEGVTYLILITVPDNLLSVKFPSTLKKLVFTLMFSGVDVVRGLIQQLPLLLARLPPHVEKIEVLANGEIFHPFLDKGEEFFPDFTIEFKKGIHFLRKLG